MPSFGIDFGTTNTSVVACLITAHGITTTPYGENNQPFPSLVALHPDKPAVFGWEVKKRRSQLIAEGYHVVASSKASLVAIRLLLWVTKIIALLTLPLYFCRM